MGTSRSTTTQKEENRELKEVIEFPDGSVEIKFSKFRSTKLNLGELSRVVKRRHSTSSIPIRGNVQASASGVKITPDQVSQPQYKVDLAPSEDGNPEPKNRVESLSASDIG